MSRGSSDRVVFRPRQARVVPYAAAVTLFVVLTVVAFLLPGGEGGWGLPSRLSVVVFAAAVAWFLHRLADVRLVADQDGVEVVNILVRRRFEWAEVVSVRMTRDDPWLTLDISDGSSIPAMGVQRSEGALAQRQVEHVRRLLAEHSATDGAG